MFIDDLHAQWVAEKWLSGLGLRWSFDLKKFAAGKPYKSVVPAAVLPDSSDTSLLMLESLSLRADVPRAVAFVRELASPALIARAEARSIALFTLHEDGTSGPLTSEALRLWQVRFSSKNGETRLSGTRDSAKKLASGSAGWAAGKTLLAAFVAFMACGATVAGASRILGGDASSIFPFVLMTLISAGLLKLSLTSAARTRHFYLRGRQHGNWRLPGFWRIAAASALGFFALGGALSLAPRDSGAPNDVPLAASACLGDFLPAAAGSAQGVASEVKKRVSTARDVVNLSERPEPSGRDALVPTSTAGIVDSRASSSGPTVVIEVFASSEDAQDRSTDLMAGVKDRSIPSEEHYLDGAVLVRVDSQLPGAVRDRYEAALQCS